jgi:hypothetical protein
MDGVPGDPEDPGTVALFIRFRLLAQESDDSDIVAGLRQGSGYPARRDVVFAALVVGKHTDFHGCQAFLLPNVRLLPPLIMGLQPQLKKEHFKTVLSH